MELNKIFSKIDDHLLEVWNSDNEWHIDCIKAYLKDIKKAINYTHCCETVKEKCTHTFEVDLNNKQVQKQRCEYIEQIHALPTRLFMYNPKTDEYIELKP